MRRRPAAVFAGGWVACLVVGLSACAPRATDDRFGDASITAQVIAALANDPIVGHRRFEVTTTRGVVTVSGQVASDTEAEQAEAVTRSVSGVVDVRPRLIVVPGAPGSSSPLLDADSPRGHPERAQQR